MMETVFPFISLINFLCFKAASAADSVDEQLARDTFRHRFAMDQQRGVAIEVRNGVVAQSYAA